MGRKSRSSSRKSSKSAASPAASPSDNNRELNEVSLDNSNNNHSGDGGNTEPIVMGLIGGMADLSIVATYPTTANVHETIINMLLPKLPYENHQRTIANGDYEYHIRVHNHSAYICVSPTGANRKIIWAFVEAVLNSYEPLSKKVNSSKSLSEMIKKHMVTYNDPSAEKLTLLNEKMNTMTKEAVTKLDLARTRVECLQERMDHEEDEDDDGILWKRGSATSRSHKHIEDDSPEGTPRVQSDEDGELAVKSTKRAKWLRCFKWSLLIFVLLAIALGGATAGILLGCGLPHFERCKFTRVKAK